MYREIQAKTALHKLRNERLPHTWDLNVYRGCGHRCQYCFALYSHRYLDSSDYFGEIFVKANIAEVLKQKLCSRSWKRDIINIGGVTDSYQPAEEHYRLMREVWRLLIRYRTPAVISTKSNLILRDIDLISELSNIAPVQINATIITLDEKLRRTIEPGAMAIADRFEMLENVQKHTNAQVGVYMMPILPFLTDSEENIDALFSRSKDVGAACVVTSSLNLYAPTRRHFFGFIAKEYPDLLSRYKRLMLNEETKTDYNHTLREKVARVRKRYHMPGYKSMRAVSLQQEPEQLQLF